MLVPGERKAVRKKVRYGTFRYTKSTVKSCERSDKALKIMIF